MRVFIFRQYATPPYLPGGTRHHGIARAMLSSGHDIYIFCSSFNHFLRRNVKIMKGNFLIEEVDGVNYVWLKGIPYYKNDLRRVIGMIQYAFSAYWTAVLLKRRSGVSPDLVIGSVAHTFAVLSAYGLARHLKGRFWIDIGDLWPEGLVAAGTLSKSHPLTLLFSALSNFLYKRAEKILVLTPFTRRYLLSMDIQKDKLVVFPPGVFFDQTPRVPDNEARVDGKDFVVTYTGGISPLYPLEEALKAMVLLQVNESKLIRLKIVGEGSDKVMLTDLAEKMSLSCVEFLDAVPKHELQKIYDESDALLVIEKNVSFGFPNKLIDYLLSMKPIILASDSDYELDDACLIKTRPFSKYLANSIKKLCDMSAEARKEIGYKGFCYGVKIFDMQNNFRKIIEPLLDKRAVRRRD